MYRYTVPIVSRTFADYDKERIVNTLNKMGVCQVLLPVGSYIFDEEARKKEFEILKTNCKFLKAKGFEVGTWLWTFMDPRQDSDFVRMRFLSGEESKQAVCPSDENFRLFAAEYICDLAKTGVDLILYDDDFRYGHLSGKEACLCENHIAYMSRELGEEVTLEKLEGKLFSGGENKYRSAWLKAKRHYFELFAKEMREALDKVRPEVRLGICSCYPNWDQDGISSYELSKLLAGDTKPFLRLSGAPYWVVCNLAEHRLQDTIEVTRMELSFCDGLDGEIVGEDDSFPRPRWSCPASYIEGFDQALRADGKISGMLKYNFDSTASLSYETGYNNRHISNMPLYEKIDAMFGDKEPTGVKVYEYLKKYEKMDIPYYVKDERTFEFTFFSYAARMLAAASIPTVYDDSDNVGIVFGENAKYLPESALKNGLILDARAAEILTKRGIDVGLKEKGEHVRVLMENFLSTKEKIEIFTTKPTVSNAYKMKVNENAEIQSLFTILEEKSEMASYSLDTRDNAKIIGSYFYENSNGEKFFVFSFDGLLAHRTLYRNYERANQLKSIMPRLGKTCGFEVCTSPDLYTLAKEKDSVIAVGLWNFCADSVEEPFIKLSDEKNARIISTINCDATIKNGTIYLSRIEPYGFAAVEYQVIE